MEIGHISHVFAGSRLSACQPLEAGAVPVHAVGGWPWKRLMAAGL